MNNPCEVSQDGTITVLKDKEYGQQTFNINSCLSVDFSIDLNRSGCALAKPARK